MPQSDLIVLKRPWHANFTDTNHLGRAYITEPHKFDSVLTRVFTASRISYNPLTAMTKGAGREMSIASTEWEWELMGASERPLVVIENLESALARPGYARTEFRIKLDEDWFKPGDIIVPEDKTYPLRVQRAPVSDGNGFIYYVVLQTDDPARFLPPAYLAPGQMFTKFFSNYEEASDQAGSTTYAMPWKLRNQLSTYKKEYSVTGDAANQALVVGLMDGNGKIHNDYRWIKYAEAEYWIQWYRELERAKWYQRRANYVLGANGRPVRTGPGIQEQLERSHRHVYTRLTEKLIREYLMDIFFGRVEMSNRSIKAFTGEYGMLAFHQAMMNSSAPFLTLDTHYISSVGSTSANAQSLAYGAQFVKYRGPNGIELELIHNPVYDDRSINYKIHPELLVPEESMRFTFLDFGGRGVESNIKHVSKEGGMKLGYVSGLHTPTGPNKGGMMSNSIDAYTMVVMDQCGTHIDDVTRCGELILQSQN